MRADRTRRMQLYQKLFDEAMIEPFEPRPLPWTARQVIHDGPGWQFFDNNGMPVLGELLRDPEDAAWLVRMVNSFEDHYTRYHALKELILAVRRLDKAIRDHHPDDPLRVPEKDSLYADIKKAVSFYADYWKDQEAPPVTTP